MVFKFIIINMVLYCFQIIEKIFILYFINKLFLRFTVSKRVRLVKGFEIVQTIILSFLGFAGMYFLNSKEMVLFLENEPKS